MGKKKNPERQYVEEKPCFDDMVELHSLLESAKLMLSALADEGDTVQRATDLMLTINEIKSRAKAILYKEE